MYVYRVQNVESGYFCTGSRGRTTWSRRKDAENIISPWWPEETKAKYEIKKYELVEVPCE
jgi:hypothetical protein